MTKKSGIVLILWWALTITIVIAIVLKEILGIVEFFNVMRIVWIVYTVAYLILSIIELIKLNNKLSGNPEDIEHIISVFEQTLKKSFAQSTVNRCRENLFLLYLIENRVEESKAMLYQSKITERNKKYLYPLLVLNVIEGNIDKAELLLTRLESINHPMFAPQVLSANKLIAAAKSRVFDQELYNATKYKSIKAYLSNLNNSENTNVDDVFS